MCIASKRLEEFNALINAIKTDYSTLASQLSKYDKDISEIYHKIETEKFDAARGYCLSKELQTKLRNRRMIKEELARIDSLQKTLNIDKLHNVAEHSSKRIKKLKNKTDKYTNGWDMDNSFIDELILH